MRAGSMLLFPSHDFNYPVEYSAAYWSIIEFCSLDGLLPENVCSRSVQLRAWFANF